MMLEYLRLISYLTVIIISFFSFFRPCHSRIVIFSNLVMAIGSFASLFSGSILGYDAVMSRNIILTPTVIIWASLVFYNFIKI